ncbi:hypothetical protein H0H81_008284 [Sphagnurus paluster]|uniref:Helicase ATP-binding domain-containing protein n=1 Tax=Sphagnurus paluster TaxID=117069 RepID=A0A9P7FSQ7_9AGAR|nr:hypothetical protein H0H81_008284 [Sphagnurus paluster]
MDTDQSSSDPALLFSPPNSSESPGPVDGPLPSPEHVHSAKISRPPQQTFFILAPSIPVEERKLYKAAKDSSLKDYVEMDVDEVIGKYREGSIVYYFARYQGGIAHKFLLTPSVERKKAAGELNPFDPSAHYVHPKSRVKMTVTISNQRATVDISSSRSLKSTPEFEIPDSEEEEDEDEDPDSDSDSGGESVYEDKPASPPIRRSGRSSNKLRKALPFKTRSLRTRATDSDRDEMDSEMSVPHLPFRRSTRVGRTALARHDETYTDDLESDLDSGSYRSKETRPKSKKTKKKSRGSRPAYGHFRPIAELDCDSSDEESAVFRKHRDICEKCHKNPAHTLIQAIVKKGKAKSRRRKNSEDEFEVSDDEERFAALGGWVRCLKCPVVAHWKCIASTQREEILKAAKERDQAEWQRNQAQIDSDGIAGPPEPRKRPGLDAYQTTEFICSACIKGGYCMGCMELAIEPDATPNVPNGISLTQADEQDVPMHDGIGEDVTGFDRPPDDTQRELLFRCFTCKRIAHYRHLPFPYSSNDTAAEIAQHYTQSWQCADCASYRFGVDKIIAWRPYPSTAVEVSRGHDEIPNYKESLPREYLVKWQDRSYRRVQWVPHMWLLSTHHAKLKNFLSSGSKVELLKVTADEPVIDDNIPSFEIGDESRASSTKPAGDTPALPQTAIPDAECRIPPSWKTVDRLLDVYLWHPLQAKGKGKGKQKVVRSESESTTEDSDLQRERELAFNDGEQPSKAHMESVSEWEARTGEIFGISNINDIIWTFIKWQDLGYDEGKSVHHAFDTIPNRGLIATWDSPPRPEDPGYVSFQTALERFISSRQVIVPKHSASYSEKFDKRAKNEYQTRHQLKDAADLDIGQNRQLKLMPFQVDGFNWLCNNWWMHQHCILADEMGLGKTVQVATFLGSIAAKFRAFPALVVVPNSTITNWVREFERWAPKLRVVPFYGEAKARDVIKKFELYHETKRSGETGAKFHVLITTYEALLNQKDFTPVFKNQPRWEVIIPGKYAAYSGSHSFSGACN